MIALRKRLMQHTSQTLRSNSLAADDLQLLIESVSRTLQTRHVCHGHQLVHVARKETFLARLLRLQRHVVTPSWYRVQ